MKPHVTLIQDDPESGIREILRSQGIPHYLEAPQALRSRSFDAPSESLFIVVADARNDGLELLRTMHSRHPESAKIFIACRGSEDLAVAAFRAGATDYYRASQTSEIKQAILDGISRIARDQPSAQNEIIGETSQVQDLRAITAKIAPANCNVLITGETGTGKELVAQMIHRNSLRKRNVFISLNCAAIPDSLLESELFGYERGSFTGASAASKGKLQQADKGTIFLDEIGDMNLLAQAKILRVIDTRHVQPIGSNGGVDVDVRIISATNQNLEELIRMGRFRADLYHRLNVVQIRIPPLRERKSDIPILLTYYIAQFQRTSIRSDFSKDSLALLMDYDWPGNVRELRNTVESTLLTSPQLIEPCHLPPALRLDTAGRAPSELSRLLGALSDARWNKSKAAKSLRWSRVTLYRKMAKYHLVSPESKFRAITAECCNVPACQL